MATGATDRLRVSTSVIATGVKVVPAGSRSSSFGVQAFFWKSLMSTTSLRGRVDSATIVAATFSAGDKRVASVPGVAAASAPASRARSSTDCSATSAPVPKNTRLARSPGPSASSTFCASA